MLHITPIYIILRATQKILSYGKKVNRFLENWQEDAKQTTERDKGPDRMTKCVKRVA